MCLRAGPVRGSSGENEKLLPRISESIRKASFLRYLNFWEKLGLGGPERKRPVALLLYYRSKQAIAKAGAGTGRLPINLVPVINLVCCGLPARPRKGQLRRD